jgi:hypothetical protein
MYSPRYPHYPQYMSTTRVTHKGMDRGISKTILYEQTDVCMFVFTLHHTKDVNESRPVPKPNKAPKGSKFHEVETIRYI